MYFTKVCFVKGVTRRDGMHILTKFEVKGASGEYGLVSIFMKIGQGYHVAWEDSWSVVESMF